MGVGVDLRVHPDGDGRFEAEGAGDVVDAGQLRLALDVKRENPVLQGELDLGFSLADAGENTRPHLGACDEHPAEFTAAHEIEPGPEVREMPKDPEIRVGLHRIAQLRIQPRQSALQPAEIILHSRRAINVGRRAVELGNRTEINRLTVQVGARVLEMVHGKKYVKASNVAGFGLKKRHLIRISGACCDFCSTFATGRRCASACGAIPGAGSGIPDS